MTSKRINIRVKTKEELENNESNTTPKNNTTLKDSGLIKLHDYKYRTVQRIIGENLNDLTLVYKSGVDGRTFQDLTNKINEFKESNGNGGVETWVYLIESDNTVFGFKTIVQGERLIECYMFSLYYERRFYIYLDKTTTVNSYYPNGIDLFDNIGYGRIYNPKIHANGCNFCWVVGRLRFSKQFDVNSIELYTMTNRIENVSTIDPDLGITNLAYQLPYETKSKLKSLNSGILDWNNIDIFERLVTRLDNVMLHTKLKQNSEVDLTEDLVFKNLIKNDNILILYKLDNGQTFGLYIPRVDYKCIADYNNHYQLTLYAITLDEVIQLGEWEMRYDISDYNVTMSVRRYGIEFEFVNIRHECIKPITVNYSTSHITPTLTLNDIFGEHKITKNEDGDNRIEMNWIYVEIYIVGRDELMNNTTSKRDNDIMLY